jgi:endonuclease/exonuclease/phosphatase family metal-dependent hydrolase
MMESEANFAVATWNVEWRPSRSDHGAEMHRRLMAVDPGIACITEGYNDFFGEHGHLITGSADWGYPPRDGRRKVMLWSATPWHDVDETGSVSMPSGRFIAGTTETAIGQMRVIGVCIPWRDAHVRTGRRDRLPWEDHLAYLEGLASIVAASSGPTIILGDFNQTHPRRRQPKSVHSAMEHAILSRLNLSTGGSIAGSASQAIDHIAHSSDLEAGSVSAVSNIAPSGTQMSDHFGVTARLTVAGR